MAAPVPLPDTVSGHRVWLAEKLVDLQLMTDATRGPEGEIPRVLDEGWVYGLDAVGGSNWSDQPAIYTCATVTDVGSTWIGKTIAFPGIVKGFIAHTFFLYRASGGGAAEEWFLWDGTGSINGINNQTRFTCPCNTFVIRASINTVGAMDPSAVIKLYKNSVFLSSWAAAAGAGVQHIDILSSNAFLKSDLISVSFDPNVEPGNTPVTLTVLFDWNTF